MPKTIAIYKDIHDLIVEKQKDIYKKHRVNIRLSDITSAVLRNYIDKSEELFNLGDYKSSKVNLVGHNTKNVIIHDDAHMLIIKKKIDIFEKHNTNLKMSDMTSVVLRNYIDKVEELFGLGENGSPKIR